MKWTQIEILEQYSFLIENLSLKNEPTRIKLHPVLDIIFPFASLINDILHALSVSDIYKYTQIKRS